MQIIIMKQSTFKVENARNEYKMEIKTTFQIIEEHPIDKIILMPEKQRNKSGEKKWVAVRDIIDKLESMKLPAGKQIDDLIEELHN